MKNIIIKTSFFTVAIIFLTGCGMKDCRCYSTNKVMENDSLIMVSVDTVANHTKGLCEDFNKEEVSSLDSMRIVEHRLICEQE